MKNQEFLKTTFLLPKNDFWVGIGSVFNIAGNYFEYNYSNTEQEADKKALLSDWQNVGKDMKKSVKKFEKENKDKLCLNL
jgi:hypothetical protein